MTYRLHDVFTAIADPSRRHILDLLAKGQMSVSAIVSSFDMSRPAVAKHLRVLHKSNLVQVQRQGRERIYELDARPLIEVRNWIMEYEGFWDERLNKLKENVEAGE